jgi:hypothetical protein
MTDATSNPPAPNNSSTGSWLPPALNAAIVIAGLVVLVVLVIAALDSLVTSGTSGKTGASDAIALITAGGAVLTGLVGAYFGINVAHQSAAAAQAGQDSAHQVARAALSSQASAVVTAAALDPASDAAQKIINSAH